MDEDFSTVMTPKEHARSVYIAGMFRIFKSVDPSSTPRAWHNSLTCDGRSECETHIRASMPSFDLLLCCDFTRDRVAV